jgi:hypothetical protein
MDLAPTIATGRDGEEGERFESQMFADALARARAEFDPS